MIRAVRLCLLLFAAIFLLSAGFQMNQSGVAEQAWG